MRIRRDDRLKAIVAREQVPPHALHLQQGSALGAGGVAHQLERAGRFCDVVEARSFVGDLDGDCGCFCAGLLLGGGRVERR